MRTRGAPFLFLLSAVLLSPLTPVAATRADTQISATANLSGIVVDLTGAPVAGAEVSMDSATARSDERGRFTLAVTTPEVLVSVRASGFADYTGRARADRTVVITLHPAGIAETVTVTASRSAERLGETAAAVTVITSAALLTSAAATVDDALRSVPGFSLFRRSSSRVANPTTQGVSLRGLAASGASRGLVLADGMPLNDPYGAWVYWDRIPLAAIDRIEVVRGSGTESVYGLNAIGGVIQLFTLEPRAVTARVAIEGGQHGMFRMSAYGGARRGAWNGYLAAERYALNGYPIVARDERGPVDIDAGLRFGSAIVKVGWTTPVVAIDARTNWLDENRENGTPLQQNDTNLRTLAVSGHTSGLGGLLTFALYRGGTDYDQSFSSVSADRTTERITARQRIATDSTGGSVQWFRQWSRRTLLIGGEFQQVSGGGTLADMGRQRDSGAYSQLQLEPAERVKVVAALRAGLWRTTPEYATGLDQHTWYAVPRISLSWAQSSAITWTASWSLPARTPTLNELYRDFQVGNVFTFKNPGLRAEDARAAEGGLLARRGAAAGRIVGFWTRVEDAITNVTIAGDPGRVLRQRMNAGTIRAWGIEAEGQWRPARWATLVASAVLTDSRFVRSEEPGLSGKRISQVPRWQTSVSVRLTRRRAVASIDWRSFGAQFDDDQNRFELRAASVLDAYLGASLGRGIQPFIAAENLLGAEVDVGRTPVRTVGTPRSIRVGVRVLVR